MDDRIYTCLHHRGFELRQKATPEVEYVDLIRDKYLTDPVGSVQDFMAERNRNVIQNARRSGKLSAPLMKRVMIGGVAHWVPQKPVEILSGGTSPENTTTAPDGAKNGVPE
ncbi:hypothetical protein [uncultured Tateyamaria sp.]|uniref:hypothetical protein n=1 Tax=uncultured Tateyamaria sp. TaxID=455651 RepID=UPI0026276A6D|nr:hypothetical protein [uncultured Tateyamaria sp.]